MSKTSRDNKKRQELTKSYNKIEALKKLFLMVGRGDDSNSFLRNHVEFIVHQPETKTWTNEELIAIAKDCNGYAYR